MLKDLFRLLHIIHILLKSRIDLILKENHLFSPYLSSFLFLSPYKLIPANEDHGKRLAKALEEAGPVFIKFGQLLSTRPDVMPENIAKGLIKLQDNLTPFDTKTAKEIIESTLNTSIDKVFDTFNEEPIAAASIAQVYEATLKSKNKKKDIAIKVVRPGIEKTINRDISLMRRLANIFQKLFPDSKRLKLTELIEQYNFVINSELDMRIEASNISQTGRNFEANNLLYVPKVYWEFTSKNILVMEKISGVPVSDQAKLKDLGVDLKLLSERGVEIFFKQVFVDNFFHADMHPGNIFVNTNNPTNPSYVAVDYAIIGSLSEEELLQIGKILLSLFNRNFLEIAEVMIQAKWVHPTTRPVDLERNIRTACEPIFEKPIENINFGKLLLFIFQSGKKFNLIIPPTLMLLQKTLINVEGLGKQLYPDLDIWTMTKIFLKNWIKSRYNPLNLKKWAKDSTFELIETSRRLPKLAERAITQISMLEKYNSQNESRNNELIKAIKKGNQIQILLYTLIIGIVFWSLVKI